MHVQMLLWLILGQILVLHINFSELSIIVKRHISKYDIALGYFKSDKPEYCSSRFCGKNADCIDRSCLCKTGYYFFSFKHGCIDTRTWNDANVSFGDNELVPMVETPIDLQHKKIVVPGTQLKRKCTISSIHYYNSFDGVKHSLIENPSEQIVSLRNAVNGFIVISVSRYLFEIK